MYAWTQAVRRQDSRRPERAVLELIVLLVIILAEQAVDVRRGVATAVSTRANERGRVQGTNHHQHSKAQAAALQIGDKQGHQVRGHVVEQGVEAVYFLRHRGCTHGVRHASKRTP